MKRRVVISAVAESEIHGAAAWYEAKREGLGVEFAERIDEAVGKIERNAEAYAIVFEGLRRCGLQQFPFNLFFKILGGESLIIACLHVARSPSLVKERGRGVLPMPKPPQP